MSMEECQLCGLDSTPWKKINGHICLDCYACSKRLYVLDCFWTDAKEKIPEKDGRYLVIENNRWIEMSNDPDIDKSPYIRISSFQKDKFDIPVKYWMELPNAPI